MQLLDLEVIERVASHVAASQEEASVVTMTEEELIGILQEQQINEKLNQTGWSIKMDGDDVLIEQKSTSVDGGEVKHHCG